TPTSSEGSSGPRSSTGTSSSRSARGPRPATWGSSASRARTTRWPMATCSRSASTCEGPVDGSHQLGWLVRDGQVLASLEVASSRGERMRGLLGRDHFDGVLLLRPARSVHTFRMRFPIDVAFLSDDLVVLKVVTMVPW